jgi:hypothetical protein
LFRSFEGLYSNFAGLLNVLFCVQGTSLDILVRDFMWIREEVLVRKRDLGFSPSSSNRDIVCYSLSLLGPSLVNWR